MYCQKEEIIEIFVKGKGNLLNLILNKYILRKIEFLNDMSVDFVI